MAAWNVAAILCALLLRGSPTEISETYFWVKGRKRAANGSIVHTMEAALIADTLHLDIPLGTEIIPFLTYGYIHTNIVILETSSGKSRAAQET